MKDKEKIKAEVERLRKLHQLKYQQLDTEDKMCLVECGKRNLCNDLLDFIDSLPEEPACEELEGAAQQYAKYTAAPPSDVAYHFVSGANWQKGKTIDKAVEWLYQKQISVPNIDEFINDFKRYVED